MNTALVTLLSWWGSNFIGFCIASRVYSGKLTLSHIIIGGSAGWFLFPIIFAIMIYDFLKGNRRVGL